MRLFPAVATITSALLCMVARLSPLQAQTINQNVDQFFGSTVYSTERREVDLDGGSSGTSRSVIFQFVANKPVPNPGLPYALTVHTQSPDWIFIQRGPSLLLKLDGTEMMPLTGNGSENARELGVNAHVTEVAYYALTPEKLRRIAAAKSVEFRIIGDRQTITGAWHADLLVDAAAFSAQGPQLLEISAPAPVNNPPAPISPMASPPMASPPMASPPMVSPPATGSRVISQAHPVLGIGFTDVPAQLAALMKLDPPRGVLVLEVTPGSIASKAGLAAGDVILEFGQMPIGKAEALQAAVARMQPGQHVAVKIWHPAQSTLDVQF